MTYLNYPCVARNTRAKWLLTQELPTNGNLNPKSPSVDILAISSRPQELSTLAKPWDSMMVAWKVTWSKLVCKSSSLRVRAPHLTRSQVGSSTTGNGVPSPCSLRMIEPRQQDQCVRSSCLHNEKAISTEDTCREERGS